MGGTADSWLETAKSLASSLALGSAILYAVGYVAERVHWNLLGHIETPTNHMEFIYRGGNVAISTVAESLLYVLDDLWQSPFEALLVLVPVVGLSVGVGGARSRYLGMLATPVAFVVALVCAWTLLWLAISAQPDLGRDLLFNPTTGAVPVNGDEFNRVYVGTTLLSVFVLIMARRAAKIWRKDRGETGPATHEQTKGRRGKSGWLLEKGIIAAAAVTAMGLCVFLPAVYGTYKYPNVYPRVRVFWEETAPAALQSKLNQGERTFLLYSGELSYVLYRSSGKPGVFRVAHEMVAGLEIIGVQDIFARDVVGPNEHRPQRDPSSWIPGLPTHGPARFIRVANEAPAGTRADPPSQGLRAKLLSWLKGISSIRNRQIVLRSPHGRVFANEPVSFVWTCAKEVDHFVVRVTVESEDVSGSDREVLRIEDVPGDRCHIDSQLELDGSDRRLRYWHLELYGRGETGRVTLTGQEKLSFSALDEVETQRVRQGESQLRELLAAEPRKKHLLLIAASFYARNYMLFQTRRYLEHYLGRAGTDRGGLRALATEVADRVSVLETRRTALERKVAEAQLDREGRLGDLAKLVEINVNVLDFDRALYWLDRMLPVLPIEEARKDWMKRRERIVSQRNFALTTFAGVKDR